MTLEIQCPNETQKIVSALPFLMVKFGQTPDLETIVFVGRDMFSLYFLENFNINTQWAACEAYTSLPLAIRKLLSFQGRVVLKKRLLDFSAITIFRLHLVSPGQ